MSKIFIGTSGYIYPHWQGVFYPENWPKSKKLEYYCQHFETVELNNTFYRLPGEKTFESWQKRVPKNFIFAVKVWRFITHIKKLVNCQNLWKIFLKRVLILKEKLGPILFQFPPFFKATPENIKKLEKFLKEISSTSYIRQIKAMAIIWRIAMEFRHESWCQEKIYQLLKKYKVAWVVVDSPSWPKRYEITSDFVYVRMHGSKILFGSKYTLEELKDLANKIKKWQKQNLDIYCYFNNDAHGFAIENAKELLKLCKTV